MADTQAYAGNASNTAGADEWNATSFAVEQLLNRRVNVALVKIMAVDGDRVDVKPLVTQLDGAGNSVAHGTIHDFPFVVWQGGTSGVVLTPAVGDIGLALFANSDISRVKTTRAEAPPGSLRRSDWADGVYLGGLLNDEPTQFVRLDADGISIKSTAGKPVAVESDVALQVTGPIDTDIEYRVDGERVVTGQQGAITNPVGGATIDAQARTTVLAILAAMRAHGLIAT